MIDKKIIEEATQAMQRAGDGEDWYNNVLGRLAKLGREVSISISEALGEVPREVAPVYAHVLGKYKQGIIDEFDCGELVEQFDKAFEPKFYIGDEALKRRQESQKSDAEES